MKKFFLLLIIISVSVTSCKKDRTDTDYFWGHGFGMGYGAGCFDERADMMNQLGVSGADADKVSAIDDKYRKLYYENKGNFEKIDALRTQHRDEIENTLNTKQRNKFNGIYSKRWGKWGHDNGRRHMGEYYGHGYGMGHGSGCWESEDSMGDFLKLSPDQKEKISAIDAKYRDLYSKDRGNFNKIDDLRVKHRKEIDAVLNKDQKSNFSEVYDNRWRGRGHMGGQGRGMMGY